MERIIVLNTWQGKLESELAGFITQNSEATDIFCFQEVRRAQIPLYRRLLPGFQGIYAGKKYSPGIEFGLLTLVKESSAHIASKGKAMDRQKKLGIATRVDLINGHGNLTVCNVHGHPRPGNKLDTPERIRQTERIISLLADTGTPRVIGGDFNLLPDTESIRRLEAAGYSNLIFDFGISSTRNRLAWERYAGNPDFVQQFFADFVFVSENVRVKTFEVPYCEISDHLPLILEIEV